jgi:hypothetical protein
MKTILCIITVRPHPDLVAFYSVFTNYDVFFIIDDSSVDCSELQTSFPNINFIQIQHEICYQAGYKHSSYMPTSSLVFNEIIGWDKAIYYFSKIKTDFDHIWFLEDDVFIYGEETIQNIDVKYPHSDILCKDKARESAPGEWAWFWPAIQIHFDRPYFQSPICSVRMSSLLMNHIRNYIDEHRRMCFIEAMFPSIAHHHNLLYDTPQEFQGIYWRHDWVTEEINRTQIFHPMKDPIEQISYRNIISDSVVNTDL